MTDYEAERRNFHLDVPEYFNFAPDVIGKWASDPNKLAMLWIGQDGEERRITFAQFDQVRKECPSIAFAVEVEPNADIARREGWTNYYQIVDKASPEFTGPKTRSDDSCLVYFTSGTVGYPKMVLHTHASYPIGHTITGKYWLDLHEDDLHWKLSEMGYCNLLMCC